MRKTVTRKQLHELRSEAATAALVARVMTPLLVKNVIESLEVGERIRRKRMSERERRVRRSLRIGAYAVGVAAAGAVAARVARRDTQLRDDLPETGSA